MYNQNLLCVAWLLVTKYIIRSVLKLDLCMNCDQNHTSNFELDCTTNQKQNESRCLLRCILACSSNSFLQVNQLWKVHGTEHHTGKWRNKRHRCESVQRRPLCTQTGRKYDSDNQLHPARSCHSVQDFRMGVLWTFTCSSPCTELWCLPRARAYLPSEERSPGRACVRYVHLGGPSKRFVKAGCWFKGSEWQTYNLRQSYVGAGVNLNELFQCF